MNLPDLEINRDIQNDPLVQDLTWMSKDGRYVDYNPNFGPAILGQEAGPVEFPQPGSLKELTKIGKTIEVSPGVSAHGGVYDKYVQDYQDATGTTRMIAYAEPDTHRVRFFDVPYRSFWESEMTFNPQTGRYDLKPSHHVRWYGQEMEFTYCSEEELAKLAPKEPIGGLIQGTQTLKDRFLKEITHPVASQTVHGVKKSLYGVVIKAPGDIYVVTDGAPRNGLDKAHGVEVLDSPVRPYRVKPNFISSAADVYDNHGHIQKIIYPTPILSRDYDVETSKQIIVGPVPKRITLKVPVWKYDRSCSVRVPMRGIEKLTHPSVFVGYATFTTDKIYPMQQGIGNGPSGAQLPSFYPDQSEAAKFHIGTVVVATRSLN